VEQSLSELISISHAFGSDIRLVWSGGGNVSVKTGDGLMFIKASGTELGQMTSRRGWRKVNIENVRRLLDSPVMKMHDEYQPGHRIQFLCRPSFTFAEFSSYRVHRHYLENNTPEYSLPSFDYPSVCQFRKYPVIGVKQTRLPRINDVVHGGFISFLNNTLSIINQNRHVK
jgi:hypothetical protein